MCSSLFITESPVIEQCYTRTEDQQKPDSNKNYQRKNSTSRLFASCQRYLQRQSSESSVSPTRVNKKSSRYDGDADTSDSNGAGALADTMTSGNGARSKIKELKKSVGKTKFKQRARVPEMEHVETGNSSPTCYHTADNDTSTSDSPRMRTNGDSDTPN